MKVTDAELRHIAELAKLQLDAAHAEEQKLGMAEILALAAQLQAVATRGVAPLAHPLDQVQRLRPDEVTEGDRRDSYQALAPQSEAGLYLVPRVVE